MSEKSGKDPRDAFPQREFSADGKLIRMAADRIARRFEARFLKLASGTFACVMCGSIELRFEGVEFA